MVLATIIKLHSTTHSVVHFEKSEKVQFLFSRLRPGTSANLVVHGRNVQGVRVFVNCGVQI